MDILAAIINIAILVYSSILHEIAHGYVAYRLGDPTAKLTGRITLNPKPHIDPYMSVLLPLILYFSTAGQFIFGGAKPVPVDPFNLKDGIKDLALVSVAGPGTNIIIAIIASVLSHLIFPGLSLFEMEASGVFGLILAGIVQWNLVLAIFNLMPIPPLDGSKIFALILPRREANMFLSIGNSTGMFILIFFLLFPIGPFSLMGIVSNLMNSSLRLLGF
ncbi:MAG TPA: site-2 protease family protein [Candidatus Limnocylindrales bacterium]|nr:site-2 protease family protein [Candidatus Limnocylindrales bacterium]